MASAHERSPPRTRELCELLVAGVQAQLPGTASNAAKTWCSIGKPTFFFVHHSRRGLTVYLRCRETDGDNLSALIAPSGPVIMMKRTNLDSAWAQTTPYFFRVDTPESAVAAVPLLVYAARIPSRSARQKVFTLPSEDHAAEMLEGGHAAVYVSRYERDPKARAACIKIFGAICSVCGFDFGATYGDIGAGFIHVHHLNPLSAVRKTHKISPRNDLRPVCPNCHEMLHRRLPPFSIEELKTRMA